MDLSEVNSTKEAAKRQVERFEEAAVQAKASEIYVRHFVIATQDGDKHLHWWFGAETFRFGSESLYPDTFTERGATALVKYFPDMKMMTPAEYFDARAAYHRSQM